MSKNQQQPLVSYTEFLTLENGDNIEIIGESFEQPIFKHGEPDLYTQIKFINSKNRTLIDISKGIIYIQKQMTEAELAKEVGIYKAECAKYKTLLELIAAA